MADLLTYKRTTNLPADNKTYKPPPLVMLEPETNSNSPKTASEAFSDDKVEPLADSNSSKTASDDHKAEPQVTIQITEPEPAQPNGESHQNNVDQTTLQFIRETIPMRAPVNPNVIYAKLEELRVSQDQIVSPQANNSSQNATISVNGSMHYCRLFAGLANLNTVPESVAIDTINKIMTILNQLPSVSITSTPSPSSSNIPASVRALLDSPIPKPVASEEQQSAGSWTAESSPRGVEDKKEPADKKQESDDTNPWFKRDARGRILNNS
jgi:hypothetical protein